jgi:copper(I)-binding protein
MIVAIAALLATGASLPAAISVTDAWTRPTPAAGMNAAGYLTIVNRGARPERLIAAASPAAARVTLHQSVRQGAVMTMRAAPFIEVPAHGQASLSPGGYHLMLEGVKRPLAVGQSVPVTLTFAGAGPSHISLAVRLGAGAMPGMAM